mgnify:CR=1 FL=1
MKEQEIGYVSKYFGQISVAAIEITTGKLGVGDMIHIQGLTLPGELKLTAHCRYGKM